MTPWLWAILILLVSGAACLLPALYLAERGVRQYWETKALDAIRRANYWEAEAKRLGGAPDRVTVPETRARIHAEADAIVARRWRQ